MTPPPTPRAPSGHNCPDKASLGFVRIAAKALPQVTNRERDKPYRRAVAATRRGSDSLSKTIRAFSPSTNAAAGLYQALPVDSVY